VLVEAEGDVTLRIARHVEVVGVLEAALVAVGRAENRHD